MLSNTTKPEFLKNASSFTDWASRQVDWPGHLESYEWSGEDWRHALLSRRERSEHLVRARDWGDFVRAANTITDWGHVSRLDETELASVKDSLPLLAELTASVTRVPREIHSNRIASVSKVYAAGQSGEWVIYDSRVARALALLVRQWEATGGSGTPYLRFPQPPARNSEVAVPGFPKLASGAPVQAGRAFIYASWLCKEIAGLVRLRCPDPSGWSPTHIEMSLFMIGKVGTNKGDAMPSVPGVARVGGALGVGKAAKSVAQNEPLQAAAQQQVVNLLQKREAKQRAARFAFQTRSQLAQVQYDDGVQRWTIFKGEAPIAAFPSFSGDLPQALANHELDRLDLREPEAVQKEVEEEKETKRIKLPSWMRRAGVDEAEVEEVLDVQYLLESGEE